MFQQPQQLSHLSSSYSEDDLAQAADVVTADLDAVLMGGGNSTPPPALLPGAYMVAPQQMQPVYLKQEHSGAAGAAGSSCGACSPQASCDTHSKAQQFWAAQQYDAAYNLVLAHSPVSQYAPAPMHGAYGSSAGMGMAGAPCAGPCCYPGSSSLMPQGSGSMPLTAMGAAQPQFDYTFASQGSMGYAGMLPGPAGAFGSAGPAAAVGMVPHAAFGSNNMVRNNSAPSAVCPSLPQHSMQPQASLQRAYSFYPAVQGGVQKRQSGSGSGSAAATEVLRAAGKNTSAALAAEVRAARKSADGSCSSKDGSAASTPRPKKAGKASASAAATAAAGAGISGRTSRGSASAAVAPAAPAGATGSAVALIKELQQEVSCFPAIALRWCAGLGAVLA